jgi:hypothetical protein
MKKHFEDAIRQQIFKIERRAKDYDISNEEIEILARATKELTKAYYYLLK